jgi:uncharacterized membrane protein YgcG
MAADSVNVSSTAQIHPSVLHSVATTMGVSLPRWRDATFTLLLSYPRSGNSMARLLYEKSTGLWSGSVYSDQALVREGFSGERVAQGKGPVGTVPFGGNVAIVKSHEFHSPWHSHDFTQVFGLIRNPYNALMSYYRFLSTGKHSSGARGAALTSFDGRRSPYLYEYGIEGKWWIRTANCTHLLKLPSEDAGDADAGEQRARLRALGRQGRCVRVTYEEIMGDPYRAIDRLLASAGHRRADYAARLACTVDEFASQSAGGYRPNTAAVEANLEPFSLDDQHFIFESTRDMFCSLGYRPPPGKSCGDVRVDEGWIVLGDVWETETVSAEAAVAALAAGAKGGAGGWRLVVPTYTGPERPVASRTGADGDETAWHMTTEERDESSARAVADLGSPPGLDSMAAFAASSDPLSTAPYGFRCSAAVLLQPAKAAATLDESPSPLPAGHATFYDAEPHLRASPDAAAITSLLASLSLSLCSPELAAEFHLVPGRCMADVVLCAKERLAVDARWIEGAHRLARLLDAAAPATARGGGIAPSVALLGLPGDWVGVREVEEAEEGGSSSVGSVGVEEDDGFAGEEGELSSLTSSVFVSVDYSAEDRMDDEEERLAREALDALFAEDVRLGEREAVVAKERERERERRRGGRGGGSGGSSGGGGGGDHDDGEEEDEWDDDGGSVTEGGVARRSMAVGPNALLLLVGTALIVHFAAKRRRAARRRAAASHAPSWSSSHYV